MVCCDDDMANENPGVVQKRRCRDVLCVIVFFVWWAGMIVIAGFAYREGDSDRLVYGVDSYGLVCGHNQTFNEKTLDFSALKNVYYLNPMEALDITAISFAKKVCVAECPSTPVCTTFPCTDNAAFVCPYYRLADDGLYGKLLGVADTATDYWEDLATMVSTPATNETDTFISALSGLSIPWVDSWLSSNGLAPGSSVDGDYYQLTSQFPSKGPCYPVYVPTTDFFNRCVPKFSDEFKAHVRVWVVTVADDIAKALPTAAGDAFSDVWSSLGERFSRYTSDLSKGFLILIVAGLVVGLAVSMIYLVIMRYASGVLVWLTLILVNLSLLGITLYCFAMAGLLGSTSWVRRITEELQSVGNPQAVDEDVWKWIAVAGAIVAAIVLIISLLMISRLRLAVAVFKVASQAVGAAPLVMLWPLIPFLLLLCLVLYWVAVTAMLYTAGDLKATCRDPIDMTSFNFDAFSGLDPSLLVANISASLKGATTSCYEDFTGDTLRLNCAADPNCYVSYKWNNQIRYAFLYHFFGLLWTAQVIVGISCVVVAATVGQFYWAGGDTNKMSAFPVSTGAKYAFIFSLGSIAFGAAIVAILMWIRFVLVFVDNRLKALSGANKCAAWLLCCITCCLWCIQKIVEFINRNAFILMAVKGTSYCVSAGRAIKLIVANAFRLLTVSIVGDTLLFLGKIAVAATCGVCAFFLAELDYYNNPVEYPKTYLSSPLWPVFMSVLIGYFIAEVFLSVYELAIDTIFLCFCDDCDTHGGEPQLAPPILLDAMGVDDPSRASTPIVKQNSVLPIKA
ncbi:hypothetical protein FOA52_002379 [Chlamydomonas sp. UWO 241]|nr:hypothetical protein FOA52_002379 [Chlamydomonas sp. UWO 241]